MKRTKWVKAWNERKKDKEKTHHRSRFQGVVCFVLFIHFTSFVLPFHYITKKWSGMNEQRTQLLSLCFSSFQWKVRNARFNWNEREQSERNPWLADDWWWWCCAWREHEWREHALFPYHCLSSFFSSPNTHHSPHPSPRSLFLSPFHQFTLHFLSSFVIPL